MLLLYLTYFIISCVIISCIITYIYYYLHVLYYYSTHFVPALAQQCSFTGAAAASVGYENSNCADQGSGPSFQFENFALCGCLLGGVTFVSWLAVFPARKTQVRYYCYQCIVLPLYMYTVSLYM